MLAVKERDFSSEFEFRTSRSSGSGGQNVNKVSTRVELIFYVMDSHVLSADEKNLLLERLAGRIRKDGALHLVSQEERSQLGNKRKVIERFLALLEKALKPVKKRKPTAISESEKERRLEVKKKNAKIKQLRRKPGEPD